MEAGDRGKRRVEGERRRRSAASPAKPNTEEEFVCSFSSIFFSFFLPRFFPPPLSLIFNPVLSPPLWFVDASLLLFGLAFFNVFFCCVVVLAKGQGSLCVCASIEACQPLGLSSLFFTLFSRVHKRINIKCACTTMHKHVRTHIDTHARVYT